jgi:hypothetical protein
VNTLVEVVDAVSENEILLESENDMNLTGLEVLVRSVKCPRDPDNRRDFGGLFMVGVSQLLCKLVGYEAILSSSVYDSSDVERAVEFALPLRRGLIRSEWPPIPYDDEVTISTSVIIRHFFGFATLDTNLYIRIV